MTTVVQRRQQRGRPEGGQYASTRRPEQTTHLAPAEFDISTCKSKADRLAALTHDDVKVRVAAIEAGFATTLDERTAALADPETTLAAIRSGCIKKFATAEEHGLSKEPEVATAAQHVAVELALKRGNSEWISRCVGRGWVNDASHQLAVLDFHTHSYTASRLATEMARRSKSMAPEVIDHMCEVGRFSDSAIWEAVRRNRIGTQTMRLLVKRFPDANYRENPLADAVANWDDLDDPALIDQLWRHPDERVRAAILLRTGDPRSAVEGLDDPSHLVRWASAASKGWRPREFIERCVTHPDTAVRQAIASSDRTLSVVQEEALLNDVFGDVRAAAVRAGRVKLRRQMDGFADEWDADVISALMSQRRFPVPESLVDRHSTSVEARRAHIYGGRGRRGLGS